MTPTEALRALAEQGRVAHPWRPGMRVIWPRPEGAMHGRIVSTGAGGGIRWVEWEYGIGPCTRALADTRTWELDLADPATVGCLLALLREARRDSTVSTVHHSYSGGNGGGPYDPPEPEYDWWTCCGDGPAFGPEYEGPARPSEGEAIAAALVWLATVGAPAGAP